MSELRTLSFNVWGLAVVSKERKARLRALAEVLARSEYDIICLQELWIHSEYEEMREYVQGMFPYARFFHTGALGSGLAIFTRLPIVEAHALPYGLSGLPSEPAAGDFFVNKAAARAVLQHPDLGPIEVWNTHMHAGGESPPDTNQAHRMAQAWQLATEARGGADKGRWVFVMGDFNSQPYSIPIALMRTYGGMRDSFLETHPKANDGPSGDFNATSALETLGMTCDSTLNSWSAAKNIPDNITAQGGKRLDYIFYRAPTRGSAAHVRCVESKVVLTERVPGASFSYSDHFGLTSTFAVGGSVKDDDPKVPLPNMHGTAMLLEDRAVSEEGASVYELSRAPSSGATASAIRASLATLRQYARLSSKRATLYTQLLGVCILAGLALTVGSAWQPKSWIQPIFTLVAFALGAAGATLLYTGWLYGRWERGLLDETMAEMETALRGLGSL